MGSPLKVALVTGASAGIGAAIARQLVREGMHVVATARRAERLTELRQECGALLHPLALDVRDRAAVEQALSTLPPEFSPIDVLVNNAAVSIGLEPAHLSNPEDWDAMVDTNVKGVLHCTHAVLAGMVERNRGHVVNIGSITGHYPYPGSHVYGGTKAFLHNFAKGLRADLLGTAVRVTMVEPGMTGGTEYSLTRFRGDAERAAATYDNLDPLRPEDVAEAVSWCLRQPGRVNVNTLELMPICQSFARPALARKAK